MSEENRRDIQIPGGVARLTEEAEREEGPTPEMQARARSLGEEAQRTRKERESAGKISLEDVQRKKGTKEIEEHKRTQRALWVQSTGRADGFEEAWPKIRADYVARKSQESFGKVYSPY